MSDTLTQVGGLAVLLAMVFAAFAVIASVLGAVRKRPALVRSGEGAALAVTGLVTLAMVCLWTLLVRSDMTSEYVWAHSNKDLPLFYKISSLWGGQEGSLLLWNWVLSLYAAAVVLLNRHKNRSLMPWVVATLMTSSFFFSLLHNFVAIPFKRIMAGAAGGGLTAFAMPDGKGLNPLLQHPAMVIHPPLLYTGYVGFVVPFAFAIAALITRQLDDGWIRSTRRWTLFAWFFQGAGVLAGARWAYVELGWGGYWGWDPVENASLMPWLVGTAFLHSVIMQEKKGMMKVWNMVLVCTTYTLCIFGTFLTRSGVVSSVHAFAESNIGSFFVTYIVIMVLGWAGLIVWRLPDLKSENKLESVVSRESSFLFNNLVLLAATFAVLWGTIFPVLSEALTGEKIMVGTPFFNKVNIPLGLLLLLLTGIGPLIAWRRSSLQSLRRAFLWPTVVGIAVGVFAYAKGSVDPYATMAFAIAAFVAATIAVEFWKGARARAHSISAGFVSGLWDLMNRNHRRYGGYIVHLGIVVMFVGFAGKAFEIEDKKPLRVGESFTMRGYTFRCDNIVTDDRSNPNYIADRMQVSLFVGDKKLADLAPERQFYIASEQPLTQVARYSRWREDVYTVFVKVSADSPPELQVFINPLVRWVWTGGFVLCLGTLFTILPDRRGGLSAPKLAPAAAATMEDAVRA